MREQYIPDLTERFPEGFDGIDLTDSFFPYDTRIDYDFDMAIEEMEKEYEIKQRIRR